MIPCATSGCTRGGCAAPRRSGKEEDMPPAEKPSALPSIDLELARDATREWQAATFGLG